MLSNDYFNAKNGEDFFTTVSNDFKPYLQYVNLQVAGLKDYNALPDIKSFLKDAPNLKESAIMHYHVLRLGALLINDDGQDTQKWFKQTHSGELLTAFHTLPIDCQVYFATSTGKTAAGKNGSFFDDVHDMEEREASEYIAAAMPILKASDREFSQGRNIYTEAAAVSAIQAQLQKFKNNNTHIVTPAIADYMLREAISLTATPVEIMPRYKKNLNLLPVDCQVLALENVINVLNHGKTNHTLLEDISELLEKKRQKYTEITNKYNGIC